MQNAYTKTQFVTLSTLENKPPRIGQWVNVDGNVRGQYLGKTKAGVVVMRYQRGTFGTMADCKSNHYLRQFAKVNGAE